MIFRVDVKLKGDRRYAYLDAKRHSDAAEKAKRLLVAEQCCTDSDICIHEIVSQEEMPHILQGKIGEGDQPPNYDYTPIFLAMEPFFSHVKEYAKP